MTSGGYLAIAISLLAVLVAVFVVTFVLYRKTPAPKGCEHLLPGEGKCGGCLDASCPFQAKYNQKEGE